MAEARRVIWVLQESEDQRRFRFWWSRFRRTHQAQAARCHRLRRARQAPFPQEEREVEPIRLVGIAAITDDIWEKIRSLLPRYVSSARRLADPRLILEAIVWVINTGSSWREIPERFGSWSSVAERYYRWCREGKWATILLLLQGQDNPFSSSG